MPRWWMGVYEEEYEETLYMYNLSILRTIK